MSQAAGWSPLFKSSAGVQHDVHFEGSLVHVRSSQDVQKILDRNKAMFNHNDGYSPDRTFRRAASIPAIVQIQWLNEGVDIYNEDHQDEVMKRLNSSDWSYLRTATGRL